MKPSPATSNPHCRELRNSPILGGFCDAMSPTAAGPECYRQWIDTGLFGFVPTPSTEINGVGLQAGFPATPPTYSDHSNRGQLRHLWPVQAVDLTEINSCGSCQTVSKTIRTSWNNEWQSRLRAVLAPSITCAVRLVPGLPGHRPPGSCQRRMCRPGSRGRARCIRLFPASNPGLSLFLGARNSMPEESTNYYPSAQPEAFRTVGRLHWISTRSTFRTNSRCVPLDHGHRRVRTECSRPNVPVPNTNRRVQFLPKKRLILRQRRPIRRTYLAEWGSAGATRLR